jgi:hypothetical protein
VLDLWTDLLSCLDLRPVPSGGAGEEHAGDDVAEFEGRNQQLVLPPRLRRAAPRPIPSNRVGKLSGQGRRDVLSEDSLLVASYAQDALLRFSEGTMRSAFC